MIILMCISLAGERDDLTAQAAARRGWKKTTSHHLAALALRCVCVSGVCLIVIQFWHDSVIPSRFLNETQIRGDLVVLFIIWINVKVQRWDKWKQDKHSVSLAPSAAARNTGLQTELYRRRKSSTWCSSPAHARDKHTPRSLCMSPLLHTEHFFAFNPSNGRIWLVATAAALLLFQQT